MSSKLSIADDLRLLYQEIIQGSSASLDSKIFFRHFNELDYIHILRSKVSTFNKYLEEGIPSEEDRLKKVIQFEEWSQDKEDRITSLRLAISDNERNLQNFVIPIQQAGVRLAIERDRKELIDQLIDRHQVLGTTADELSGRESNIFATYLALYKDVQCVEPLFPTFADFENLESHESERIMDLMSRTLERLTEQKIRQISVMPFFLNNFSYAKESLHTFLQKPLVNLTSNQLVLFSQGQRNLNILSQCRGSPPELMGGVVPNDLVTWYDQQYSVIIGKRNLAS